MSPGSSVSTSRQSRRCTSLASQDTCCRRALLIEIPLAPEIRETRGARETREIVRGVFPDRAAWLSIDAPLSELRWADGVHLDERSALIVARAIEKALAARAR